MAFYMPFKNLLKLFIRPLKGLSKASRRAFEMLFTSVSKAFGKALKRPLKGLLKGPPTDFSNA